MVNTVGNAYRFCIIISLFCVDSACQRSEFPTQASSGFIDFGKTVERAYNRLAEGNITKKDGFYNECSVDFATETGVRVSESVCDDGDNALKVTIRVTDPTTRPPSQRQDRIAVVLGDLGKKNLIRGNTEEFPNGTTIVVDRTGQSVTLTRRLVVSR
ncbi:MAG: hypothetical protein ACRERU_17435 [Methylococcales bacterium]